MRFVALGAASVFVVGAWFLVAFRPAQSELKDVRADVERTQSEVTELEAKLLRLQELRANEEQLRADVERFDDALPLEPAVSDFIRQVQDAGNDAGVDFLSVSPSLPASPASSVAAPVQAAGETSGDEAAEQPAVPTSPYQSIGVSITADGGFFAIQKFVHNIETLRRAIRIDDFALTTVEGGGSKISLSIKLQMFMKSPVAAAASGGASPGS